MAGKRKINLLLIEDNPGDARLIQEMLKDFQLIEAEIETVPTLERAMNIKDKDHFHIILLDMSLPDAFGLDLLKDVEKAFANKPIVILTGLDNQDLAVNAVKEGAQDYLYKDKIDSFTLEKALGYAIDRSKFFKQKLEIEAAKREKEKLEEINRKLNHTLEELQKSNQRLEEFAYVATHNMRAPVVNLKELLDMYQKDKVRPENRPVFEKLEYTINMLYVTLHELINIVSLDTIETQEKTAVNFEEILNQVKEMLRDQIASTNAQIKAEFEVEKMVYLPDQIRSVLLTLLSNSIRFRKPDVRPEILVRTEISDHFIRLSVKDNGIGIDLKKYRKKLFKMFQKLDSKNREGKGLGLYLLKTQVEALGGMVDVESEPGVGTEFKIYLKNNPE